jgi:DNA-binding NarL/FixJ family response regulator
MRHVAELLETLSSLPLNVAILEPDGTISEANGGWRAVAAANGLPMPDACIGTNYFDACEGDQARALRDLVARRRDVHTCIYPCHSPAEARCMLLVALPLASVPPTGLVLLHVDLTSMLPAELATRGLRENRSPDRSPGVAPASFVRVIEQTILRTMMSGPRGDPPEPTLAAEKAQIAERLANRQREVLALLGQGKSNAEIAGLLGISTNTAKLHVAAILRRLGLDNRMQAVALGARMYAGGRDGAGKPDRRN